MIIFRLLFNKITFFIVHIIYKSMMTTVVLLPFAIFSCFILTTAGLKMKGISIDPNRGLEFPSNFVGNISFKSLKNTKNSYTVSNTNKSIIYKVDTYLDYNESNLDPNINCFMRLNPDESIILNKGFKNLHFQYGTQRKFCNSVDTTGDVILSSKYGFNVSESSSFEIKINYSTGNFIFIPLPVKSEMSPFDKMEAEKAIYECYNNNNEEFASNEKISSRVKTFLEDSRWQNFAIVPNFSINSTFYGFISIKLNEGSNILKILDDYGDVYIVLVTTKNINNPNVNCTLFVNNFTETWIHLLIQISPIRKYVQIINEQIFCLQPTENNKSNKYVIYTEDNAIKIHRSNDIENISCENIKRNKIFDVLVPTKNYQDDCNIPKTMDIDGFEIICCRQNCFEQKDGYSQITPFSSDYDVVNILSEWNLTLLFILLFLLLIALVLLTFILLLRNNNTLNDGLLSQLLPDCFHNNSEEDHYEKMPELNLHYASSDVTHNSEEYTADGYLRPNSRPTPGLASY